MTACVMKTLFKVAILFQTITKLYTLYLSLHITLNLYLKILIQTI